MRIAAAALLAFVPLVVAAQVVRDRAADSIDFTDRQEGELELKLPAAPKAENLIPFDARPWGKLDHYVDAASITVGADGIVRFTSVSRGEGSAQNVIYEGIRCRSRERKVFAYGKGDGEWSEARNATWGTIGSPAIEGYRFVLYESYFCPSRQIIRNPAEGIQALKLGGHPRAQDLNTGFPIAR